MISAKVVADSICLQGDRLTTLEVIMPRYILAEFNTHRMLSKNSASSRAIPFSKMVKAVEKNPFIPYAWQKDHKGMQGTEYFTNSTVIEYLVAEHIMDLNQVVLHAKRNNERGVTKQLANRKLEYYMYHKVLVSGTEWDNFFNLRCPQYTFHNDDNSKDFVFKSRKTAIKSLGVDNPVEYKTGNVPLGDLTLLQWLDVNTGQADIHMMFLAEAIYDARNESTPVTLKAGEWHIPYGENIDYLELGKVTAPYYMNNPNEVVDVNKWVIRISIARCARLSYQTLGDNPVIAYEKDLALYETLSTSGHWSPFEHVAKAMSLIEYISYLKGNCELDETNDRLIYDEHTGWCRNFRGFIQYRELLD